MHWRKGLNFITNCLLVGAVFNAMAWIDTRVLHYLFSEPRLWPLGIVPYCILIGILITARR